MKRIWHDNDKSHVTLSPEEALEIAEALLQATQDHPDCEYEISFTGEDGKIRWFVKAKPSSTKT